MCRPAVTFHWTHRSNLRSIRKSGLDPSFSKGKKKVVWSCEEPRVGWALGHVSRHHEVSPDDMVLLRIETETLILHRSSFPMVWTCTLQIPPEAILGVKMGITEPWVSLDPIKARKT